MFVFNVNQFCLRRNVESRQHTFHFFSHQVADLLIYVYLHMSPNIYVDHVDIYIYIFFILMHIILSSVMLELVITRHVGATQCIVTYPQAAICTRSRCTINFANCNMNGRY